MEAQVTITLTQEEVSLLHTALCDYRGKIGNLAAQMIADGVLKDLQAARQCIFHSFEIETYRP